MKTKKDIGITLILIGSILILFGVIIILLQIIKNDFTSTKDYAYDLEIVETKKCNKEATLYYSLEDGRNIYTYCLDEIKVKNYDDEESEDLKDLLSEDETFIDTIITNLNYVISATNNGNEMYKDGGSRIYTNKELALLNCHTLDGNKDIYIGPKGMQKENNFCERKIDNNTDIDSNQHKKYAYDCTFTRTYNVVNTLDDYKYDIPEVSYIVVDQFQNHLVEGLMLPVEYKKDLKVGEFYEFTYKIKGTSQSEIKTLADLNNYIPAVYANNPEFSVTITSVKKATKTGLEQIMDDICKYNQIVE